MMTPIYFTIPLALCILLWHTVQTQKVPETNVETIQDLLRTCRPGSLESCNMCSLCLNGAICRQKLLKTTAAKTPASSSSDLEADPRAALAYLKSLVDFTCYCVPGFTGTYCQKDIDECLNEKCLNNATCVDKINGFKCECPPGFAGMSNLRKTTR